MNKIIAMILEFLKNLLRNKDEELMELIEPCVNTALNRVLPLINSKFNLGMGEGIIMDISADASEIVAEEIVEALKDKLLEDDK